MCGQLGIAEEDREAFAVCEVQTGSRHPDADAQRDTSLERLPSARRWLAPALRVLDLLAEWEREA